MGNQSLIPERFFAELDKLGVAAVRQRLAAGAWGKAGQRVKLARLWLSDNDRRKQGADPWADPPRHAVAKQGSDPSRQTSRSIFTVASEGSGLFPEEAAKRSAAAAERSADDAEAALAIARDANFRAALALAIAAASLVVHLMLVFVRPS
jgi:hypothetical protein